MNFGVHHQCFKSEKAVEFVLQSFRKFHPDDPYVLWSDCGSNYSELCEKYNVKYFYSDVNVGIKNYTKDKVYELFDRVRKSCEIIKKKYIIWMEDDVLVQNKIQIEDDVEFSGQSFTGNYFWGNSLEYISKKYQITPNVNWFGTAGGAVILSEVFTDHFDIIEKFIDEDYEHMIKNVWTEIGHPDIMITIAHLICGKKYSANPQLADVNKTPDWRNLNYSLVHSFKEFY